MKRFSKRCLAVILSIAMVVSILYVNPVSSYAASFAGTFVKINSLAELTAGKYVMVVDSGYAMPTLIGTWLGDGKDTTISLTNGNVVNPDSKFVWDLAISQDGVTLQDSNNKFVKPTTDTTKNDAAEGSYNWKISETNGIFTIKSTDVDAKTIACASDQSNRFRPYKNDTISKDTKKNYATAFTLYKFDPSIPSGPVKLAVPTANPLSGTSVVSGSSITLNCVSGASIRYCVTSVSPSAWVYYTAPITVSSDTTIEAYTEAPNADSLDSDHIIFEYTLAKETEPDLDLFDPITSIPDGAVSVLEAAQISSGKAVTVVGQLVYRFGNYNNTNSAILQDVINGQVYALQIYNALSDYKIGDILKITGTSGPYGGVPQINPISKVEVITPAAETKLMSAQEFTSINALKAVKDSLLSEWVVIKDVRLGTYSNDGSTKVTDSSGVSMDIYRAATYPAQVTAGDEVDLYACVSKFVSGTSVTDQLRVGKSTDYVVTKDIKVPSIILPTFESAELGKDYTVSVTIVDNVGVAEASLIYTVNSESKTAALLQSTSDSTKWEATIPGSVFVSGVSNISVQIFAKDKNNLVANSEVKVISIADKPQVDKVTPARNASTGDEKRPQISVTASNIGIAPTAKLTLKLGEVVKLGPVGMTYSISDKTFSYTPSQDLEDGRYTASVVITRADAKTITYEWPFTIGTPEYSLYFGQLHSHTSYSDGSGSLEDALAYIGKLNKGDNINFVAFTDHSNYFDKSGEANPEASLYDKSLMTKGSRDLWASYKGDIANFNATTDSGVIALGGFEMTWSGGPGHMNTWNTEGIVSRNNTTLNNKKNDAGMKAYYALLSKSEGASSVSQFNHPGTTFGTFSDFAYWDAVIDTRVSLVEVGNGEGAIGSGGYFPSYQYYTMALDKGWHVAPTNNQDNHKGKWGNANDARDVIITDDFTEQGIYSALKERKVYATEDKNLEIIYTVNDEAMGSIIQDVPEKLNINVTLSDSDTDDVISKAEVIANSGRVVHTWNVSSQSKELSVVLKPDYTYYYIRVTEKDGDIAVTAPVWVGKTKVFGVSNVESNTFMPVTGEPLTIKTTLFNSEATDITIKSLTYSLNGEVIDAKTDEVILAKGATQEISYAFTPAKAKVQTLNVEAVMVFDGLEYTFTKSLSLDVRDAKKLVYIGIDGSHHNEYVSGNYYDSMTNFSKLAAENNVRCVVLNTSEKLLEAAKNESGKYKMLVLTAPSRRNGTALREPYDNYSDEEIAAIKGFAEAGGSIVLCGWSDLYENYKAFPAEDHMAAQQNKLLQAIGASLRISDDGTYDDVLSAYKPTDKNDNNKARLYLNTYNWDNALTKGIIYDAEHPNDNTYTQVFSHYGGASIYVADAEGKPASTLPANVSPVVYAHASTYSRNCDGDGLGGNIKYEYAPNDNRLMILATETVTHKNGTQSLVIVDGAAFLSNFEIKAELDNSLEKNYSNYTILENLIKFVKPTQIDKIADVQQEVEEGVKFTVEGIVTSNASGYDKTTAFFDCIYLQDDTAGINAFPVAGDFKVGQKVRVTGTTSSYQGERQLNVSSISLVDSNITNAVPKKVTAKQINDRTYLGGLVELSGMIARVERANGAVQTILVKDSAGEIARIFIDGYITLDKEIKNLEVGNSITAVGLSSYDNTFAGLAARIRIKDRADIVCSRKDTSSGSGDTSTPTTTPTTPSTTEPTPTSKPTPTPAVPSTEDKAVVRVDKAESTVIGGKANVKIEISEEALKATAKDGKEGVTLSLGKEVLQDVLTNSQVKKGVVIDLAIPAVKDAAVSGIVLNTDVLLLAKEAGQKLTINVANADAGYTVSIPASELKKVTDASKDLNLAVALEKDTKVAAKAVGVISVGTEGTLPAGMVVTVPVEKTLSLAPGKKVYIYRKNAETGALEEVPNNQQAVAADGTLKLSTLSGGDYVICTEKAKDAVKLVDKATVSVKSSVEKGKKLNVNVGLPQELAKVAAFGKGDPLGQEEAKVTYKVSDKSIATVSSNGTITAKKKGSVKVTVEITLENGQKKTFNKTIKVK
jgi:hypothetical protein